MNYKKSKNIKITQDEKINKWFNRIKKAHDFLTENKIKFECVSLPDDNWFFWDFGNCYIKYEDSDITYSYEEEYFSNTENKY